MEPAFKFEVTNGTDFRSMSVIWDILNRQAGIVARATSPDDPNAKQTTLEANFMACMARYMAWARPTGWVLDHVHYDTGGFGILFSGQYTCLVMMADNGSVSGHS